MHDITISLSDEAYSSAIELAEKEGFVSAEVYLSDLILSTISAEADNTDHFLTDEIIAELDEISKGIQNGSATFTLEEATTQLSRTRENWISGQPR